MLGAVQHHRTIRQRSGVSGQIVQTVTRQLLKDRQRQAVLASLDLIEHGTCQCICRPVGRLLYQVARHHHQLDRAATGAAQLVVNANTKQTKLRQHGPAVTVAVVFLGMVFEGALNRVVDQPLFFI